MIAEEGLREREQERVRGRGESEAVRISCQTGLVTVTIKTPERERKKCFLLKHYCDTVAPGVLNENGLFVCEWNACMLHLFVCIWVLSLYDLVCVDAFFSFSSSRARLELI